MLDGLELMHILLGHPDIDLRVDIAGYLLDIQDVRYSPERGAVVLLLHPHDVSEVLSSGGRAINDSAKD
jgi:hypothetical protein